MRFSRLDVLRCSSLPGQLRRARTAEVSGVGENGRGPPRDAAGRAHRWLAHRLHRVGFGGVATPRGCGFSLSGRGLTVGAALSPRERLDFGRALEAAVHSARAARY